MVESRYSWESGVELEEHTRRKHKILREYLARYLAVRCAFPQQSKFRLAIVEGFAGGGRYKGGEPGSPLVFIEELRAAAEASISSAKMRAWRPSISSVFLCSTTQSREQPRS
ncbi:MAG: three-Cys-motif partner protein TcmP [Xanthobacteraceae bacterium]